MKVLAFGEVLWDMFPNGKKLGGAPMNFCAHFTRLGGRGFLLSSIGDDELGKCILENMCTSGLDRDFIIINKQKSTGVCKVSLDNNCEPTYDLICDVAYDNIILDYESLNKINDHNFDVLYFGSLAQRNKVSADAFDKIIDSCSFKEVFCDINIRQNYYSKELIEKCLKESTIIKINRDEFKLIQSMGIIDTNYDMKESCRMLCNRFNIKIVIITLDADGAIVYSVNENILYTSDKCKAVPVSTVGAGDSFSACFLYNYLNGIDIKTCIDRANMLGAYVVGFEEAIPEYSKELEELIK